MQGIVGAIRISCLRHKACFYHYHRLLAISTLTVVNPEFINFIEMKPALKYYRLTGMEIAYVNRPFKLVN